MPKDKKCIKTEEICEEKKKMTSDELNQVTGGNIVLPGTHDAVAALQVKAAGIEIAPAGQPGSGSEFRIR